MKKKRNILKRNSGFVVTCVIAAGASFLGSDILMSRYFVLTPESTVVVEGTTEAKLPAEKKDDRVYETDAFTVMASGSVIKGVEKEKPKTDLKKETETEPTSADEPVSSGNESSTSGSESGSNVQQPNASSGETGSGSGSSSNSGSSSSNSGSNSNGGNSSSNGGSSSNSGNSSSNGGSSSNSGISSNGGNSSSGGSGSSSGSNGDYTGPDIIIEDPGNGDYTYGDSGSLGGGSSSGGSSGSGGSSSNGGNSSSGGSSSNGGNDSSNGNGSAGEETPWTPDDVMVWGISSRYISESELYNFDTAQIRVLRNEILALNGRIFQSQDLIDYFSQKSWYTPLYSPEEFDANMFYYLNDYEEANLQVVLDYESALWGY